MGLQGSFFPDFMIGARTGATFSVGPRDSSDELLIFLCCDGYLWEEEGRGGERRREEMEGRGGVGGVDREDQEDCGVIGL